MNDTPTNNRPEDVNDVLSSIRELVSQEAKSHAENAIRKRDEPEDGEKADAAAPEPTAPQTEQSAEPSTPAAEPLVLGGENKVSSEPLVLGNAVSAEAAKPLVLGNAERVAKNLKTAKEASKPSPSGSSPEPLKMDKSALVAAPAAANSQAAVKPSGAVAPMFDETAIRSMVGEMVREELEGELGKSLNRTIRKMVRREVMRAIDDADDELNDGLKL